MTEKGRVIKIEEKIAFVAVPRKSACGDNCAMCKGGCEKRGHIAKAENNIGASVGDTVVLFTKDSHLLKVLCVVYFLPLLVFFFAYCILFSVTENNTISTIVSVILFALTFVFLKIFDKKLAPIPMITEIVSHKGKDDTHGI